MGLDVYLVHSLDWERSLYLDTLNVPCTGITTYERDSEKYVNHCFRIGYFRSSYNTNGFNDRMRSYGLPTLYHIFCIEDHSIYYQTIHWNDSLERCNEAIAELAAARSVPETDFVFCNEALCIIKKTIEFVLSQPDPENFRLAWSA